MSITLEPTQAPSLRKRARRLAEAATTPLVPADFLDLFHPLRAGADLSGRIVEVRPETADAATLVIKPGADWAGHVPGQYVRIGVDVDGVRQWRAYSLTRVAASAVSGRTSTIRPRSSAPARSGWKRSMKSAGTSGVVAASASRRARWRSDGAVRGSRVMLM